MVCPHDGLKSINIYIIKREIYSEHQNPASWTGFPLENANGLATFGHDHLDSLQFVTPSLAKVLLLRSLEEGSLAMLLATSLAIMDHVGSAP